MRRKALFRKYGLPAAAGLLAATVGLLCLLNAVKKAEEKALAGWYSENAVRFCLDSSQPVYLWEHALPQVESVSFLSSEPDSGAAAVIKFISYNPGADPEGAILLPPHAGGEWTISAWNRETQMLGYIGRAQPLRMMEGAPYYRYEGTISIRAVGSLGFRQLDSFLDVMAYMPFSGVIPAGSVSQVYVAEGSDAERILEELAGAAREAGAQLQIKGAVVNARKQAAADSVTVTAAAALLLLFLYFVYLWFGALEKEIYILHLFGCAGMRTAVRKVLPPAGIMLLIYVLFVTGVLLREPELVREDLRLWSGAGAALGTVCLLMTGIGCAAVRRLRDTSRQIKR